MRHHLCSARRLWTGPRSQARALACESRRPLPRFPPPLPTGSRASPPARTAPAPGVARQTRPGSRGGGRGGARLGFRPAPGAGVTPSPGREAGRAQLAAPRPAAAAPGAIRGQRLRRALRGTGSAMVAAAARQDAGWGPAGALAGRGLRAGAAARRAAPLGRLLRVGAPGGRDAWAGSRGAAGGARDPGSPPPRVAVRPPRPGRRPPSSLPGWRS